MSNTIQKILAQKLKRIKATSLQGQKKISDLIFDLNIILAKVINQPKEFVLTHPEFILNWKQNLKFWWLTKKYALGYPVAYLTGHKEFFNLDFIVTTATLIPRPDTEIMVKKAIEIINANNNITLIDIGTGSGCIPISILKNTNKKINTIATDISLAALNIARKNAKQHQVKISLRTGNLLAPIKKIDITTRQLLITANLPYLNHEQIIKENSIKKEPFSALYGGIDGLEFYRQLLKQLKNFSVNKQLEKIWLLLEIDPTQTEKIKEIIKQNFSGTKIEIQPDLSGLNRLVIAQINW